MSADPRHVPPLPAALQRPAAGPFNAAGGQPPPVAAQLLATEHWSLLATRSMTWSEVMSRITVHLTVSSASLVVLALVAQATDFGPEFRVMAVGLAAAVLVFGTLTGLRVFMASDEDAAFVRAMNRLRGAYAELAPGIEPYFMASTHDDEQGLWATYTLGTRRTTAAHVLGSTSFFLSTVNSVVAGTLGALGAAFAGLPVAWVWALGLGAGAAYLGATVAVGWWLFRATSTAPLFPSAGTPRRG